MFKRIIKKIIVLLNGLIKEPAKNLNINPEDGLTEQELISYFNNVEVEDGSIIFIHSGFKSLGQVKGGPETVIKALLKEFVERRNITIAMPSFTIAGSMEKQLKSKSVFDVRSTPTVFKGIPLAFQSLKEIERSIHPTHSIMAIGSQARWLVDGHHTCGSTFGPGSPFGKLLERNSYLMGLGTKLGAVTFYHAVEDGEVDFPFNVYTPDSPYEVTCLGHKGEKIGLKVFAHNSNRFINRIDKRNSVWLREIYTALLESHAKLRWYKVGKAQTWLCPCSNFYTLTKILTYSGLSIYSSEKDVAQVISKNINL